MFTHDGADDVSGLSAADLAQRLVDHSARHLKSTPNSAGFAAPSREFLPRRVKALTWSTTASGVVAPRSALLRGDVVQEAADDPSGTIFSLSLSADVRFRFAQTRQRRLLAVLSSRRVSPSLRLSTVEDNSFFWLDECAPRFGLNRHERAVVLQRRILRWVLSTFSSNPLLRNIPMQTLETAFPALLAYAPHEREELAKQAAEIIGRGTVIWYGGTLIKQLRESPSHLIMPLLAPREERYAATLLFALANVHLLLAGQLSDAAYAARYLIETYGTQHVAQSPALTRSLLIVAAALAELNPGTTRTSRMLPDAEQSSLTFLVHADAEGLASLFRSTESNPPPNLKAFLSQLRDLARQACYRERPRPLHQRGGKADTQKEAREEEDVNAFFSVNNIFHVHSDTLRGFLAADADTQRTMMKVSSSDYVSRARLLEWIPKWWEDGTSSLGHGATRAETVLRIDAKTTKAALSKPITGVHSLLAAVQPTRKRRHSDDARTTSPTVRAALEEADVQLKRRTFLQLMDTLALSDGGKSSIDAAALFLQQQQVEESLIHRFTESLTAMRDR